MNKDYYQIMGILDDSKDVVIRAAFRALAQKYHPDKWAGSKNEANVRMADINEAFDSLRQDINKYEAFNSLFVFSP